MKGTVPTSKGNSREPRQQTDSKDEGSRNHGEMADDGKRSRPRSEAVTGLSQDDDVASGQRAPILNGHRQEIISIQLSTPRGASRLGLGVVELLLAQDSLVNNGDIEVGLDKDES
jgi:hypothetical protein